MSVNARFSFRADTAANWTANNPVLLLGEVGLESDTSSLKMGDGVTAWAGRPYLAAGPPGATGAAGSPGTPGTATLDFGSGAGILDTSVVVTGQTGILSTSNVQAWIQGDTTSTHSADEHLMANITAVAQSIVPGVGFTLRATAGIKVNGQFTVRWLWF